jgi:tetratricopeptide (TPR) repeat protein
MPRFNPVVLVILFFCVALLASSGNAMIHDPRAINADPATATEAIAPRLDGLGTHTHPVTTSNPDSQYFFDQGLRLTYGFNHSEALRSFKEAVRLDPNNAMAYWGWALVLGPNINLPMQPEVNEQAFDAIQQAMARTDQVSPAERAYIEALQVRYAPVAPDDRSSLDQAYADAMAEVVASYPDDSDAATLYAAALMNLSPWNYWNGDGSPKPNTTVLLDTLQTVVDTNPEHPGALHYYIHTVEAVHPGRGEPAADTLQNLMPGAGHMVHMPSHIYMRVGRYADSFEANRLASDADASYITQCRAQGIYPLNYYPHNLHFMVWSAMFQGASENAMIRAREVQSKIPIDKSGNAFGAYETFLAQPLYVMVRFGMWDRILAEPEPAESNLFVRGVWHYARGMAYANTGSKRKANSELKKLRKARERVGTDYGIGFGSGPLLLTIAELVLNGDLDSKSGKYDRAIATLARAARLEDSLLYNEPPDWYFPTRHVLGAVLLEGGYAREAEVVYWQDLRKNPANGFSLLGLSQALQAQGNDAGAAEVRSEFETAWRDADVQLTSSRF